MIVDESIFDVIEKAEKITLTRYTDKILWRNHENLDGYIYQDNLIEIIEDLICEVESLEELVGELKKNG